jgi:hypothetical protein
MTTATPRCAVADLPPAMCAHCRGLRSVDEQAVAERTLLLATGRWIAAQYPGQCEQCGEWFTAGMAIRCDHQGWRAECCADGWQ